MVTTLEISLNVTSLSDNGNTFYLTYPMIGRLKAQNIVVNLVKTMADFPDGTGRHKGEWYIWYRFTIKTVNEMPEVTTGMIKNLKPRIAIDLQSRFLSVFHSFLYS